MKISGLAFHVHHDRLIEFCYDYDERVRFIKENKPAEEQGLRLRLFQMIPVDKLPKRGLDVYVKARDAYDEARDVYDKARDACDKAQDACVEAWDAYVNKNKKALEKLHSELCPNCPWDGKTIFGGEIRG